MFSLTTRATIAALLVTLCAVLPSIYAITQTRMIERSIEQASAAGDVRRSLEDVEDMAQDYANFIDAGGKPQSDEGRAKLYKVLALLSATRLLVANEVALLGPEAGRAEQEEITWIDTIEDGVRSARLGNNLNWTAIIQTAISNEREEVAANERVLQRKMNQIEAIIVFEAAVAAAICLVLVLWFRKSIMKPLQRLAEGASELGNGYFQTRIETGGLRELDTTIRQFNRMAEQVQSQRGSMMAAQDDLEEEVERRTGELREAHSELAELTVRRADFLADISHELRTPIAIVRGEAEVTLRNLNASAIEYRESLARVLRQAEALTQLVDDLLFVARQDAGSPAIKLAPCDLADLVRCSADDVRSLVMADGGAITVETSGLAIVYCDQARIGQVLRILIDNAIRYCAEAPRIDISVLPAIDGHSVIVRDNGIGIREDEVELVFERFRRGSNGRDRSVGGTGLGLPLAKAIVEAHGGTINCQSVVGQGTTMTFFLKHSAIRLAA